MKWLLALALSAPSVHAATQLSLPYTMNAGSTQAILHNALVDAFEKQQNTKGGSKYLKQLGDGSISMDDGKSIVTCGQRSAGMLTVQTYGCTISVR